MFSRVVFPHPAKRIHEKEKKGKKKKKRAKKEKKEKEILLV
jgi:hypothetical protein